MKGILEREPRFLFDRLHLSELKHHCTLAFVHAKDRAHQQEAGQQNQADEDGIARNHWFSPAWPSVAGARFRLSSFSGR